MIKLLHTADWHLGKKLNGHSRVKEQRNVLNDIINISTKHNCEAIIVAGDIYDVGNPPIEAEKLFIKTIKELSCGGTKIVIIIAGNHDNANRLSALFPLAKEFGIIIYTSPNQIIETGLYGSNEVLESSEGVCLVRLNGKLIYFNCLVYPTELNMDVSLIDYEGDEYSLMVTEKIKNNMSYIKKDIPVIVVSHLFITGTKKQSDESSTDLGGALRVNLHDLPKVNYIALGHIHKPMIFKDYNCAYSGSIVEYRDTESKFSKSVNIVEISNTTEITKIPLTNYKPIVIKEFDCIDKAIEFSNYNNNGLNWLYFKLNLISSLSGSDLKILKSNPNIISIEVNIVDSKDQVIREIGSIREEFDQYYMDTNNKELSDYQLKKLDLYLKEYNETAKVEN